MAHTPLLRQLARIARLAEDTQDAQLDFDAALAKQRSRRDLLKAGGAALGLAALPKLAWAGGSSARIAIVGGGLAGLACAYTLKKSGLTATVYEASSRLGGRCSTNRTAFGDQVAENGGELIDTYQVEIQALAKELGLTLDDLLAYDTQAGGEDRYWFGGSLYTLQQAYTDFQAILPQLRADLKAAPFPTLYNSYTARGVELDYMSITDWINRYVPGGGASRLGQLLDVAYQIEYGAACSDQSALNLLYLLGYSSRKSLEMFGESNERYHIRGGNDQLVSGMAERLDPARLKLGHELTAIAQNRDGSYTLTFNQADSTVTVEADHVVMALPFSILRYSVDFQAAGFDERKQRAINQMGMGNNSKFQLQFSERLWRAQGCNGATYADTGFQDTWEVTRAQPGTAGVINNFTGGQAAVDLGQGSVQSQAQAFLAQWEKLVPGITDKWTGQAILNYWPGYKWTRGAYGYYKPGQYTQFVGYEGVRQGNCHFCGEHTSLESQGYLNGAIETGQRCAKEIVHDLTGRG